MVKVTFLTGYVIDYTVILNCNISRSYARPACERGAIYVQSARQSYLL